MTTNTVIITVMITLYGIFTANVVITSIINRCKPKHVEILLGGKSKTRVWALPIIWVLAMLETPGYLLWVLLSAVYGWYVYAINKDMSYINFLYYLLGENKG